MATWNDKFLVVLSLLITGMLSAQEPLEQIVALEFGEPTRDCAGRGRLCEINNLVWSGDTLRAPDAIGLLRLKENNCWELKVQASSFLPPDPLSEDSLYLTLPLLPGAFPQRDSLPLPLIPAGAFPIHQRDGWKIIHFSTPKN